MGQEYDGPLSKWVVMNSYLEGPCWSASFDFSHNQTIPKYSKDREGFSSGRRHH